MAGLLAAVCACGFLLRSAQVREWVNSPAAEWIRAAGLMISALVLAYSVVHPVARRLRTSELPDPRRRRFLQAAGTALYATPAAAVGYGLLIGRSRLDLREADIAIPNLPRELHGLRIVQLSDIHLGEFLSRAELARAVGLANETKADLGFVTGDLISSAGDPLDQCLNELRRLKVALGLFGCHGNHEIYADAEDYVTAAGAAFGLRYLRNQAVTVPYNGKDVRIAGVDYQPRWRKYLQRTQPLVLPGVPNILLSHNPDVFPTAAAQGFDLTVAGHTHGGQVNFEILRQDLNVARFFTPYVDGLYQQAGRFAFVNRGIGTIGVPIRAGAPPEVALLRLCAT